MKPKAPVVRRRPSRIMVGGLAIAPVAAGTEIHAGREREAFRDGAT
jgi:hypothetical protein